MLTNHQHTTESNINLIMYIVASKSHYCTYDLGGYIGHWSHTTVNYRDIRILD